MKFKVTMCPGFFVYSLSQYNVIYKKYFTETITDAIEYQDTKNEKEEEKK